MTLDIENLYHKSSNPIKQNKIQKSSKNGHTKLSNTQWNYQTTRFKKTEVVNQSINKNTRTLIHTETNDFNRYKYNLTLTLNNSLYHKFQFRSSNMKEKLNLKWSKRTWVLPRAYYAFRLLDKENSATREERCLSDQSRHRETTWQKKRIFTCKHSAASRVLRIQLKYKRNEAIVVMLIGSWSVRFWSNYVLLISKDLDVWFVQTELKESLHMILE